MNYKSQQNSQHRYLIDTNILFALEDNHEIDKVYANFYRLAKSHNIPVFVHEVIKNDIERDKDLQRREISLSKISKYQLIENDQNLPRSALEADFGKLMKQNDVIDATLLYTLKRDLVGFLVTEDKGLHDRAERYSPELRRRVLFINDATDRLKQTYEPKSVPIYNIKEIKAYTIFYPQKFFVSLQKSYPTFDQWWKNKCVKEHRSCWVVYDNNILAGLVVWKNESRDDTDAVTKADRILKLCTFKVSEEKRGIKLGELLLKQMFWYLQKNRYDLTYLTTYKNQGYLRSLIEYYGFSEVGENKSGELIYERNFSSEKLSIKSEENLFEVDRKNYPRFVVDNKTHGFIVPIQEKYHDTLYPDLRQQLDLFSFKPYESAKPGNTIRKVYLCRAPSGLSGPGSILFFYKNKSDSPPSQAVTALGILESMKSATSVKELMLLTGGRSVYSETELIHWKASPKNPVKVINYLLVSYIEPPIQLSELKLMGLLKGVPRSICGIKDNLLLRKILKRSKLEFEI